VGELLGHLQTGLNIVLVGKRALDVNSPGPGETAADPGLTWEALEPGQESFLVLDGQKMGGYVNDRGHLVLEDRPFLEVSIDIVKLITSVKKKGVTYESRTSGDENAGWKIGNHNGAEGGKVLTKAAYTEVPE